MNRITVDAMLQELLTINKPLDVITTTSGYTATLQDVRPESIKQVEDSLHIGGSSDSYDVTIKIPAEITYEVTDNAIIYNLSYNDNTSTSLGVIDHY